MLAAHASLTRSPLRAEEHSKCRVVAVVLLGCEQEHAELRAVETPGIRGVDAGATDVLDRI